MTLRHPVRAIEKNGEKHVRWLFSPSLSLVFPATRAPPTHSTFHLIVVFFAATMKSCGKASSVSFLHFAFCRTSREVAPRGVWEGCSRSYFNCEWNFSLCLLRLGFWLKVLHNGSSFGWIYYNLSWILIYVARWKKGFGLNSYEMFSDLHRNVESCDDLHPKKIQEIPSTESIRAWKALVEIISFLGPRVSPAKPKLSEFPWRIGKFFPV